jgi:hypothetical protein
MRSRVWLLGVSLLTACSDPDPVAPDDANSAPVDVVADANPEDTTPDDAGAAPVDAPAAPVDAPTPPDDAGNVPVDVLTPPEDSGLDAASDDAADVPETPRDDGPEVSAPEDVPARQDAPRDVAMDARTDVPTDVRTDVAMDARTDVPMDVRTDVPVDVRTDVGTDVGTDVPGPDAAPGAWRSALFPDDWRPLHAGGRADSMGRFLHDFSFAGYRRGERPPYGTGTVVRTVDAALGDGRRDATAAIQSALDAACASTATGLRVVVLPAGTFLLRFPTATPATDPALRIACSRVVLRGAGPSMTRLLLDDAVNARSRALLRIASRSYNVWSGGNEAPLTRDITTPTRTVSVAGAADFTPGELVAVRTDVTEDFRVEHRMNSTMMGTALWPASTAQGLLYPRRVVSVNATAGTLTLDAPTRYRVLARDNARIVRPRGYLTDVGVEDLAFGMREHPTSTTATPGRLGDSADDGYTVAGTAAYAVHGSVGIRVDATADAWLYRVETFSPQGNTAGAHVLSSAMFLTAGTHRVTVERCRFGRPQYRGGGGNGYLFWVEGDDNLLVDDTATDGRHNFITAHIASSGNVFLRARSVTSRYSDDSHRLLAVANLYDGTTLDRAWLQAVNRGATSSGAGFTATHTVFWNTRVVATHPLTRLAGAGFSAGFAIETAQFGWGYAIGTSGPGNGVATRVVTNGYWSTLDPGSPTDFVEGVGMGTTLYPPSLYEEQRRRRLLRGE